ncbi:aminotransferase [Candidatus Heimdallarchaeota archaeon B3_Heim]|nr:MAG: aminotransferase [Candidatus Heimdallarchaeota archaeon B3_Heim]
MEYELEQEINNYKSYFDLDGYHYLNCAYMGPLATSTKNEGIAAIERKTNPKYVTKEHFFCHSTEIRQRFSKLINEDEPSSIAIIPSVSYGMSIVANNVDIREGQKIIVVADEMPSNYYIWYRLAKEKHAELVVIDKPSDANVRSDEWNQTILSTISDSTAIVSIPNVHWLDGCLFDLATISKKIHEHGGLLIVDGTQSIGAYPFDNKIIRADAVVCAGYKWLLGPYAISIAYFSEKFWKGKPLEEGWLNRKNSNDFESLTNYQDQYREGAIRFDMGQSSNFLNGPMLADSLKNTEIWTPSKVSEHCASLNSLLVQELCDVPIKVLAEDQRGPHYVGLEIDPILLEKIGPKFSDNNVSASVRNGNIRVTPHIYNDIEDIKALVKVVRSSLK